MFLSRCDNLHISFGTAPRYLGPLTRVADESGRRTLRSTATKHLVSSYKLSTVVTRDFLTAVANKLWNTLLDNVSSASASTKSFQHHLKFFPLSSDPYVGHCSSLDYFD